MTTLELVALTEVVVSWLVWVVPFIARAKQQKGRQSVVMAPAAKRGIWFQAAGFSAASLHFRHRPQSPSALLILAMVLAPFSVLLVWTALRHLGKQWRIQAGLYADHELIRTGPYSLVRHPIYASMFGMLISTGIVLTWWPSLLAGIGLFLIGIEIRVRAEDDLLNTRFGPAFQQYRSSVPAYLPFIR